VAGEGILAQKTKCIPELVLDEAGYCSGGAGWRSSGNSDRVVDRGASDEPTHLRLKNVSGSLAACSAENCTETRTAQPGAMELQMTCQGRTLVAKAPTQCTALHAIQPSLPTFSPHRRLDAVFACSRLVVRFVRRRTSSTAPSTQAALMAMLLTMFPQLPSPSPDPSSVRG